MHTPSQKVPDKVTSVWLDMEKLETVKAPPPKSVLIVKKAGDDKITKENKDVVENAIMSNSIAIVDSYKNTSGDLMVVCESDEGRDELSNIVKLSKAEIVLGTPKELKPGITIVGLPRDYTKEEIKNMLVMQNSFIKNFSMSNNIDEHISIHAVKPLKNNPSCFQVFANVSCILREGMRCYKDKVILGLTSCKIYDRYHIKRCNNCHKFGHYARDCPTIDTHICGKCSENHLTNDCQSYARKCINCVRNNIDEVEHATNSYQCPCYMKQQESLKKKLNEVSLNLKWTNVIPNR